MHLFIVFYHLLLLVYYALQYAYLVCKLWSLRVSVVLLQDVAAAISSTLTFGRQLLRKSLCKGHMQSHYMESPTLCACAAEE